MKKRTIILMVIFGIIAVLAISIAAMSGTEEFQEGYRSATAVVDEKYQGIYVGDDDFPNQTITVGETSVSGALTIRDVRTIISANNYTYERKMYTWSYVYARVPSGLDTKIGLVRASYPNTSLKMIAFGKEAEVMAKMLQENGVANIETVGYDETYNWCGYSE
jgi:hypothetical protein